jgi:hypothetical protein
MARILAIAFLLLLFASAATAQVYVNEVMSSNNVTIKDEDGDPSDWFELYNSGPAAVSLDGYYATDTPSLPTQWRFPNVTLAPQGFLMVWASGKNHTNTTQLHTNFAIKAGGEPVQLIAPDGVTIVDATPATSIPLDKTYGRQTDGGTLAILAAPTPGTSNNAVLPALSINFSRNAGVYNGSFTLAITTSRPATIRYTLDGSTPNASSPIYNGSILITNNSGKQNNLSMINTTSPKWTAPAGEVPKMTVLRAIAIDGNTTTPVKTATYIVDRNFTVPVFSVTTDYANLFDYEYGIYTKGKVWDDADLAGWQGTPTFHPANYRMDDWERPVHLEVFDNGTRVVDQDIGIQISGQGSRARQQKSIRFYARGDYGKSSIAYRMYNDSGITSYKRLTLRNPDDDNRTTFIRDVLAQELVKGTPLASENYRPAVLIVNGEYWGLYPLREKANQHYLASHYGVDSNNVVILEDNALLDEGVAGDEQPYLDLVDFVNKHDMADASNYAFVQTQMDTDSFARYYALETFVANTDWPSRNIVMWRLKVPYNATAAYGSDGRWRWVLHDADYAFGYQSWQGADYDMFHHIDQTTWGGALWRGLSQNEEFRDQFVVIAEDQLLTNFSSSNIINTIDRLAAGLAPEVPTQIARWTTLASVQRWEENLDYLRQFATSRPANYRQHLAKNFGLGGTAQLTINADATLGTVQVNTLNITGTTTYFQDVPVTLTATPKPGNVFLGWSGAASGNSTTIKIVLAKDETITAVFAPTPGTAPEGAPVWITRKWPATQVRANEFANVTLELETANPAGLPVSVQWSVDGTPVNASTMKFQSSNLGAGNHSVTARISAGNETLEQHWDVQIDPATGQSCYTQLATIPPSCDGGTITLDVGASCRTIKCESANSSMTVLACEKPTAENPAWFEMYRQSYNGSGLKICLGTACISNNGFAQANFPMCFARVADRNISFENVAPDAGNVTVPLGNSSLFNYSVKNPAGLPVGSIWYLDGEVLPLQEDLASYEFVAQALGTFNLTVAVSSNETAIARTWLVAVSNESVQNSTNSTNSTVPVCATGVSSMPVSCTGGVILEDSMGGCRTVICSGATGSLQVLACDKPGSYQPQYFEMYKQIGTGYGVSVCLGTTCIEQNGYAKSGSYPICMNVGNTTGNTTNTTGNTTGNDTNTTNSTGNVTQQISFASTAPSGTALSISELQTQQFSYTLSNPSNIATAGTWSVDGAVESTGTAFSFGPHASGTYNVSVLVNSSVNNLTKSWIVTVTPVSSGNVSASVSISPWFPQGNSYVFLCSAQGFEPTSYDFYFGDGNKNLGRNTDNVYYTYMSSGTYNVSCVARDDTHEATGRMTVVVG